MQFLNYTSLPLALSETIASIHERIPLGWDPLRTVSLEKFLFTQAKLRSEDIAQVIVVALDERQELIGFHWVTIHNDKGLVLSTWVDEFQRLLGVGKSLKQLGEAWAVKQNKRAIISKVHLNNLNMKTLNIRCGFALIGKEKEFLIFKKNLTS